MTPVAEKRPNTGFRLTKWYMDCVSVDGEAFIAYIAVLQWKTFTIHYHSVLAKEPGGNYESAMSMRECPMPYVKEDLLRWRSESLNVYAEWHRRFDGTEQTLIDTPEGYVRWKCTIPRAASVVERNGSLLTGTGYVESLEMTLPPWRLPFKELRWGRFVSETDSLVWIDWRGGIARSMLLHNGKEIQCDKITDSNIISEKKGLHLHLDRSTVLREGPLVTTALSKIPGLSTIFPNNILQTYEQKWLSRSVLKKNSKKDLHGFSIHEIVRFP